MTYPNTKTTNCSDPREALYSSQAISFCFRQHGSPLGDIGESPYDVPPGSFEYWYDGYNISANTSFGILIGSCIDQYCLNPDSSLQGCAGFNLTSVVEPNSKARLMPQWYMSGDPMYGLVAPGCDKVNTNVNQDLIGPGVSPTDLCENVAQADELTDGHSVSHAAFYYGIYVAYN